MLEAAERYIDGYVRFSMDAALQGEASLAVRGYSATTQGDSKEKRPISFRGSVDSFQCLNNEDVVCCSPAAAELVGSLRIACARMRPDERPAAQPPGTQRPHGQREKRRGRKRKRLMHPGCCSWPYWE